jgi:hypothetical protein
MNLAIENGRKNLILALLIFNFAFWLFYAKQKKGCSTVVNYWTDIVTR